MTSGGTQQQCYRCQENVLLGELNISLGLSIGYSYNVNLDKEVPHRIKYELLWKEDECEKSLTLFNTIISNNSTSNENQANGSMTVSEACSIYLDSNIVPLNDMGNENLEVHQFNICPATAKCKEFNNSASAYLWLKLNSSSVIGYSIADDLWSSLVSTLQGKIVTARITFINLRVEIQFNTSDLLLSLQKELEISNTQLCKDANCKRPFSVLSNTDAVCRYHTGKWERVQQQSEDVATTATQIFQWTCCKNSLAQKEEKEDLTDKGSTVPTCVTKKHEAHVIQGSVVVQEPNYDDFQPKKKISVNRTKTSRNSPKQSPKQMNSSPKSPYSPTQPVSPYLQELSLPTRVQLSTPKAKIRESERPKW